MLLQLMVQWKNLIPFFKLHLKKCMLLSKLQVLKAEAQKVMLNKQTLMEMQPMKLPM